MPELGTELLLYSSMKSSVCLNCTTDLQPEYSFCPSCGQKAALHRLSLHDIFHDAVHYFTHADKGFFQLLKALLLKTGTVGKEYISGRRKKYFSALNFYLLVAAIYVLLINIETKHGPVNTYNEQSGINQIKDPVRQERVRRINARKKEAFGFMNKYSNFIAMAAVPLLACIFWLFYLKGQYNYVEHLVSGMYMVGFTNLLHVAVLVPISMALGAKGSYYSLMIFILLQIVYFSVYYYHFMNKKTRSSLFKAIGVSAFSVIFWTALTSFLIGMYISTGFWGLMR